MYDFDEIIDRRHSNSTKWVGGRQRLTAEQAAADPLPMWLAVMDFRVAPPIAEALQREIQMDAFGYGGIPDSYLEAVLGWQARRFGWHAKPEWIARTPGVISALNIAIQAFTQPGDHVLVQPPVYVHFMHDVLINGRRLALAPLAVDAAGKYRFDPDTFEAAVRPGTKLFILRNPHNPTGNVWTRDELTTMASICERHGILVVSDEVHQDLVFGPRRRHLPFAMLDHPMAGDSIVCTAPGKTFNIAGLQCANVFTPNKRLREAFQAQCERNGVSNANTMGTAACEAAYRYGEPWADAMLEYVRGNQQHFAARVRDLGLPLTVTPTDSLYLAWIDCRRLGMPAPELHDLLLRKVRLWLDLGTKFGAAGEGFVRINLACPRSVADEALLRLANALLSSVSPTTDSINRRTPMLNDWKAQLANTRRAAGTLNEANPKFVQAFQALNAAQGGQRKPRRQDARTDRPGGGRDSPLRQLHRLPCQRGAPGRCHRRRAERGARHGHCAQSGAAYFLSVRAMEAHKQFGG